MPVLLEWSKQLVQVVCFENDISKEARRKRREQIWFSFDITIKMRKNWIKNKPHTSR